MILRRGIAIAALACGALGCHGETKSTTPAEDPDRASGADRQRSGAVAMPVQRPVTDEVSWAKGDATDWKSLQLDGKPGLLEVRLHWDNANADLLVDVFDGQGTQIASSPGLQPGSVEKRITVEIPAPGLYFVRVSAHGKDDASVYTLEASWDGGPTTAPPVASNDTPDASVAATDENPPPTENPPAEEDDDRGLQGRIVSAYREGGQLVIHLDKGSAAGVAVGKRGAILEGPSGTEHVAGGSFTVTQVVDEKRSIAKSDLKTVGRNTRVILYLAK